MTGREPVAELAGRFAIDGEVQGVEPHGAGLINDTYLVTCRQGENQTRFLMQRINATVFHDPPGLLRNFRHVTAHLDRELHAEGTSAPQWCIPQLVPTRGGEDFCRDTAGFYWRMFPYLVGVRTLEVVATPAQAAAVGQAYGRFLRWMSTYDGPPLVETIPGFHDTPRRYAALERVVTDDPVGRVATAADEIAIVTERHDLAGRLHELHQAGRIPRRVVHNDAKPGNVLLDAAASTVLGIVDLDTVMLGLMLYDYGDMVRATVSGCREDEKDLRKIGVQEPLFAAASRGYLSEVGSLLTATERAHLVLATQVITYEQGIRFLTDYLAGDLYYKTKFPLHNLDRSRTQFVLLAALEAAAGRLADILADL